MKTVVTIVIDEDKSRYGWRLDRHENDEELISKSTDLIKDINNYDNDTLTSLNAIHAPTEDVLKIITKEFKEQLQPYNLYDSGSRELCVL